MRAATSLILGLLAGAGCLSSGTPGGVAPVDAEDGVDDLSGTDTAADTALTDTGSSADADAADSAAPDTSDASAPDVLGPDTSGVVCGDGELDPGEACDDGNGCALDGCRAAACQPVPTVVLTALALDGGVAFDLDDADGDHDVATGGDNRLAANDLVASVVNPLIAQSIDGGRFIQLVTFGDLDNAYSDPALSLALHPGVDPACPAWIPPRWLGAHTLPPAVLSDAGAWSGCTPPVLLDAAIIGAAPSTASPEPPVLAATTSQLVTLPAGPLGELTVARSHLEAHVVGASGVVGVLALTDGRLSGVVPASALYRIDTSSLMPGCPTALHAVLALVGHIDQDAEGNGARDWIQFTLGGLRPCFADPVTIVGCCNDGDCDDFVPGAACALDPKIRDGYSAGFRFEARAVRVTGQVDGAAWCSE